MPAYGLGALRGGSDAHIRKTAPTIFKVVVTTFDSNDGLGEISQGSVIVPAPFTEVGRLYALKARGVRPPSNG
jgi:hypothetical protein